MSIGLIWCYVWLEVAMVTWTVLNDDVRAVLFLDIFVVSHRSEICWIKHHQTPRTVMHTMLFLFVCLFVWGLSSHMRIFHSYGDVIITGEGLQFFTFTRHSWQLSSEGFLSVPHLLWHGASVFNGHLRGPVTVTPIAERLEVELSLPVFTTY